MNARVSERLNIENALRRALALINVACEFSLVRQPIVHLPERWVIGVESLLRWRSADLGEVEPPRFVPVAEESGRIYKIGEWFVREACRQLARWRAVGLVHLPLTINVSGLQLKAKQMTDVLLAATPASELTPQDIEIELTESALVSEGDTVNGTLAALAEAGFHSVVDDFGTGYSNLANLKRFDISKLKIDQIFVRDINIDPDVAAITHGIVGLARNLGLRVVAKGIEHVAQLDDLLASGCEEAQGFLLATPMDAQTFQQQASLNKC
jgi:EAL domain-containing protein (putative c-di-GMP-specific phosphodiesterase class I)